MSKRNAPDDFTSAPTSRRQKLDNGLTTSTLATVERNDLERLLESLDKELLPTCKRAREIFLTQGQDPPMLCDEPQLLLQVLATQVRNENPKSVAKY